MELSNKVRTEFYQNLGKLFYAIAAADSTVNTSEFNTLKEIVKADWLSIDTIEDSFNSDAAFQIEIVFDWLDSEKNYDANDCFSDFVYFKRAHKHLFSSNINSLILKTAREIASSFAGVNKSELMMLAKLDIELKKGS